MLVEKLVKTIYFSGWNKVRNSCAMLVVEFVHQVLFLFLAICCQGPGWCLLITKWAEISRNNDRLNQQPDLHYLARRKSNPDVLTIIYDLWLYFVSPWERPWCQRVFQTNTFVIGRATCVFSHAFKKEHLDWCIKDTSCGVYPWARSVASRSFSGVIDLTLQISTKLPISDWFENQSNHKFSKAWSGQHFQCKCSHPPSPWRRFDWQFSGVIVSSFAQVHVFVYTINFNNYLSASFQIVYNPLLQKILIWWQTVDRGDTSIGLYFSHFILYTFILHRFWTLILAWTKKPGKGPCYSLYTILYYKRCWLWQTVDREV